MKVYDPITIRTSIQRNAALPRPEEFSAKARGAVRTIYNAELKKLPTVLPSEVDETRYLIWGFVLGPKEEPFHLLRSADLLPPQFNALGLWASERVGGEYRMRESFPEELAWALTVARVIRNAAENSPTPITLGELLALYHNSIGPIDIAENSARSPGVLSDFVAEAIKRGGDVSDVTEDRGPVKSPAQQPAPALYAPVASQADEYDLGF